MFFDPLYLLFMAPALVMSLGAQIWVKRAFSKYSKVGSRSGYSGGRAAALILNRNGVHDVEPLPIVKTKNRVVFGA